MDLNALTAHPTLTAAHLTILDSLPFADVTQDTQLMHSTKSATLAVLPNTMTIYLEYASTALLDLPAVLSKMDSSPSAHVLQDTLLMLITKYATSVPQKSTITLPLQNVLLALNAHPDVS
jgi:hypothetical protein